MIPSNSKIRQPKYKLFIAVVAVALIVCFVCFTHIFNHKSLQYLRKYSEHLSTISGQRLLTNQSNNSIKNQAENRQNGTTALKQVFNIQNRDTEFGKSQTFHIKIDRRNLPPNINVSFLKSIDIYDKIQINTVYDYANLTATVNFTSLKQQLQHSISYELISFPYEEQLQSNPSILPIANWPTTPNQLGLEQSILGSKKSNLEYELKQSIKIAINPTNKQLQQQQYYYYDKKFNIGNIAHELPLCIYGAGYRIFEKNKYEPFFQSLARQNYSNFHIVYVDDHSPQNDIIGIVKHLYKQRSIVNNRIQIVRNLQRLGPLANLYFWVNKYCNAEDIVVHVDTDDSLLGSQTLKVINAAYQNPQVWFMYSRYLLNEGNNSYVNGFSKPIRSSTSEYRHKYEYWDVSALRSFRKKLFEKIPLSAAIEYHYNETTDSVWPHFYDFAYDAFEIFALLELSGNGRVKHISDFLYIYSGSASNDKSNECYAEHEKVDDFKFRIKTPFNELSNINEPATYIKDYKGNNRTMNTFQKVIAYRYRKCLRHQQIRPN